MIAALILARGNSKGLPRKNLRVLCGKPMVSWTLDAAVEARRQGVIDDVFLTTEDDEIAEVGRNSNVTILKRPLALSQDHVQSSEVFLFALRQLQFKHIKPTGLVLLAPTSPLRTAEHIMGAVELWKQDTNYSVLTAWRAERYHWQIRSGEAKQIDGDPVKRLGRQWRDADDLLWVENGSVYVCDAERFSRELTYKLSPFKIYEMSEKDSLDIDTLDAFIAAEKILEARQ
jgi:CMP-N,N'-diacetyllegionaminic acid synthase